VFNAIFYFILTTYTNLSHGVQIPTDLHPVTNKSALETVLTVLLHILE